MCVRLRVASTAYTLLYYSYTRLTYECIQHRQTVCLCVSQVGGTHGRMHMTGAERGARFG